MKTKKQIISLFAALTTVKVKGNAKFKYATLKNLKLIESEIEALRAIETEIADTLKPMNEKRNAIIEKYATEQPDGSKAILQSDKNYHKAVKEIKALEVECSTDIESHKTKMADYEKLLAEAVEPLTFHEITEDNLPDDITDVELEQLMEWEIVK